MQAFPSAPLRIKIPGHKVSGEYVTTYETQLLLSSRLYCWLRILTVSAGRAMICHDRVVDSSALDITTSREFHPTPKNLPLFTFVIVIRYTLKRKNFFLFTLSRSASHYFDFAAVPPGTSFPIFIVRPILFLAISTESTCTSTTSPTLTASSGCLINLSVI